MNIWSVARFALMGALLFLVSCASLVRVAPEPNLDDKHDLVWCCKTGERFPQWLVEIVAPTAPLTGRIIGNISYRKSYLTDRRDAHRFLLARLRPLDIVVVGSTARLSNQTIPGHFGHAIVYLGTEQQLRSEGLWQSVDPQHREAISQGQIFLEAEGEDVHLSDVDYVFDNDHVAVLRPRISNNARRREIMRDYIATIGTPFDYFFDLGNPSCLYCTELIHRVVPELGLPIDILYGREVILPDAVVAQTLRGQGRLSLITYVKGERDGWAERNRRDLVSDIEAAWAPAM